MHILRLPEELIAVVRLCHASTIADPCSPPTLPATHAGLRHALLACVNALPHADAAARVQGLWPRVRHYERPHAATRQQALPRGRHAGGCAHRPSRRLVPRPRVGRAAAGAGCHPMRCRVVRDSPTCSRLQPYVLAATWGATIATKCGALLCHWGPTLLQAESLLLAAPPPPCSATYRRAPARLPEAVAVRCITPLLPEAEVALRVVALRCAAHARAPPRSPPAAEALFARELAARETAPARRTAEQQQQRWSGERSLRNELQRSLQPQLSRPGTSQGGGTATGTGTAAPGGRRKADTKALFAHELAGRDHAAREAGRQAQKQHEAAARRQWHKLGGPARSAWERQAAHEQDRWRRHCQGADTAAELAARLVAELQQEP